MNKDYDVTKEALEFKVDANMNVCGVYNTDNTFTTTDGSMEISRASITGNPSGTENYFYTGDDMSCWNYWERHYYPQVIKTEYPVYIQERSKDKGKKALEIIKVLKDKKMLNMDKVKDFIDMMDTLIKIL